VTCRKTPSVHFRDELFRRVDPGGHPHPALVGDRDLPDRVPVIFPHECFGMAMHTSCLHDNPSAPAVNRPRAAAPLRRTRSSGSLRRRPGRGRNRKLLSPATGFYVYSNDVARKVRLRRKAQCRQSGNSPRHEPLQRDGTRVPSRVIRQPPQYSLEKTSTAPPARPLQELALAVRDSYRAWIETQQTYYRKPSKRCTTFAQFPMGRTLRNAIMNLGIEENHEALHELGLRFEALESGRFDRGPRKRGVGKSRRVLHGLDGDARAPGLRITASGYSTHLLPAHQGRVPGETPTTAPLRTPGSIDRPEHLYPVKFYGRVNQYTTKKEVPLRVGRHGRRDGDGVRHPHSGATGTTR